jgi:hypothetical protein
MTLKSGSTDLAAVAQAVLPPMVIVSHGHVPLWFVLVVSLAIGLLVPLGPTTKDQPEEKDQS